jgi:glutathione peroxidase
MRDKSAIRFQDSNTLPCLIMLTSTIEAALRTLGDVLHPLAARLRIAWTKKGLTMTRLVLAAALIAAFFSASAGAGSLSGPAFQFEFTSIAGQPMPLDQYRGKVLLVVNTASRCGHTPQYEGLQALWEKYRERGLVVIGVPSNDFGGQEPEDEAKIAKFCKGEYGVTFPMTQKYEVRGAAHPFYRWAESAASSGAPRWNFHKYVVSRDGGLAASFSSIVEPGSPALIEKIEEELAKQAAS